MAAHLPAGQAAEVEFNSRGDEHASQSAKSPFRACLAQEESRSLSCLLE